MSAYGNMDKGLPGLLFGLTVTHQIDSRLAKGAIGFGVPCFGTGDGEQVEKAGEGALLGITGRTDYDATDLLAKSSQRPAPPLVQSVLLPLHSRAQALQARL